MTIFKIAARWKLIVLAILLTSFVSGCANVRQGTSWPALDTLTIDEQTYILVAYKDEINLLMPDTGQLAPVLGEDGSPRTDDKGDAMRWSVKGNNSEEFFTSPLRVEDDNESYLVFPSYNQNMVTIDLLTGSLVDTEIITLSDGVISEILVGEDLLYVPYRSKDVVAIDPETYQEQWRVATDGSVWATPLLHDGVLYIGSVDHMLYAVDAGTGQSVWNAPIDLDGAVAATPLYYQDHLYIGSYSHKLAKISLDGAIIAEYEGENWLWSTPVIADEVLYYTDLSGNVYALDADTLALIWSVRPATRGIRPAPLVTDDFVIVASRDGFVYWLNRADGEIIFSREVEGQPELLSDLLIVQEDPDKGIHQSMVIAGSVDDGRLLSAFSLDNGLPLWVYGR